MRTIKTVKELDALLDRLDPDDWQSEDGDPLVDFESEQFLGDVRALIELAGRSRATLAVVLYDPSAHVEAAVSGPYSYCPIHGDLLAGGRSMRCIEAAPGHEYPALQLQSESLARQTSGHQDGAEMIASERRRHIEEEGHAPAGDIGRSTELADAAQAYLLHPDGAVHLRANGVVPVAWPWDANSWKPTPGDRVRELVKAGSLIAAAIDARLAEASQ